MRASAHQCVFLTDRLAMNEDEFYDALETGLDALDAETALLEQLEDSAEVSL